MIRHSVLFSFKAVTEPALVQAFFKAAAALARIPGVQQFEILRQISKKNGFDYGISMEFNNLEAYDHYSNHPDHQLFIQDYWLPFVADFLEIDYEKL